MPKSYKVCEVMQQCDYMTLEQLEKGLDHNAIKDFAWICHDKDVNADGSLKAPHYHIMLRFKDSVPTDSICKWFDVKENYINRIKGRFADALAYLTHKNQPDKFQYLEEEVHSNFNFQKEVDALAKRSGAEARKQEIRDMIVEGTIRQYNYWEFITPLEHDRFNKTINNAFKYRQDQLENTDRDMTVVYIYGSAGCGKTTYAKMFCENKGYGKPFISSSSNDLFDNYKGQDAIILDDIRSFGMDISDILKMLDNNTSSTIKSRYRNKYLECKLLIITCPDNIETFYNQMLTSGTDDIRQLKRRIKYYIKMGKENIDVYIYQPLKERYDYVERYKNPVQELFEMRDLDLDERKKDIDEMFGFTANPIQFKKLTETQAKNLEHELECNTVYHQLSFK